MRTASKSLLSLIIIGSGVICSISAAQAADDRKPDATALVDAALHYWRGDSSYTELTMTIHRPDWQRSMSMVGWTRGKTDSLVRFTSPPGDAGNATLKLGQKLWIFNPKLNQVIKLPFSMMAQNWMGSDFSYNDLAKTDQIVSDYTHKLGGISERDGHKVYTVICTPKPNAPVVWGKQELKIRDDHVLIAETFFDQDMKPVRRLQTTKIAPLGGRPYPVVMRMGEVAKPKEWTELHYTRATFGLKLPQYLFTLSNLRNPRHWSAP